LRKKKGHKQVAPGHDLLVAGEEEDDGDIGVIRREKMKEELERERPNRSRSESNLAIMASACGGATLAIAAAKAEKKSGKGTLSNMATLPSS